jgi:TonB-dependent receptor
MDKMTITGKPVSVAFAVCACIAAAQAHAQAAAPADLEEVVVSGFRRSLDAALDLKRESTGSSDSIFAEDIADFPDLNLSESLQRLPGVSIARDAGEGRQISVRGLGPQFTRVRINGMEAMTANGSTDAAGGTNRNRSFDFNTFASELFNQITVHKTASAEIEEGSLGATVDLNVARPFDYDGFTFAASAQAGYNDLSDGIDPRAALLISNTFADGRLGALVSVAYTKRELADNGSSTVRWQNGGTFQTVPAGFTNAQVANAFRPRIPRYDLYSHEQERLGITGSLQFQPTETTLIGVDAMYSKFDATRSETFLESPNFSAALTQVDVLAAEIDGTNTLVYGQFDDVDVRSEARYDELSTEFTQYTGTLQQKFGDAWQLDLLLGRAESEHRNPIQTTLLWDALDIDGYVYDFRQSRRLPLISYGSTNVANPAVWTLTQIRLRPQTTDNTFDNAQAELSWEVTDRFKLTGGLQYKKYEFVSTEKRRSNGTNANLEGTIPASALATPTSSYAKLVNLGSGLSVPAGTTTSWVVPDLKVAADLLDLYNSSLYPLGIEPATGNNFTVEEQDTGGFLQADFNGELFGRGFRGNIGVRYVKTEQTSQGYTIAGGTPVANAAEYDYDETLPALNLVYDLSDELLVRFGASKVMARAGLGALNPGSTVSVSGNNRTVAAGNPELEPIRATALDLGMEWYFAPEAMFSVALFYKDIDSFVQTIRETGPFSENPLGLPDSVAITACGNVAGCSPSADWNFDLPANTPGGDLKGVEVAFQTPFAFLPAPFNSFGTVLNYTYVDSKVAYLNSSGAVVAREDLTGLSRNAANATLYFDNGKFSARVSAAYRDDYLTTVPGRNGNDVEGTASTLNVDFSSSLALNDQFSITFEALNLTDQFDEQWVDSVGDRLSFYHHTGRQYFLGARVTF